MVCKKSLFLRAFYTKLISITNGNIIKRIIVDTSSILFGLSKKIDVFEAVTDQMPDYEPIISTGIIAELEKLASTKRKNSRDAKIALMLIKAAEPEIIKDKTPVDKWIIDEAADTGAYVCTNDSRLRGQLKNRHINVLTLSISGRFR
jgi:rRNA-processing protein FCF1